MAGCPESCDREPLEGSPEGPHRPSAQGVRTVAESFLIQQRSTPRGRRPISGPDSPAISSASGSAAAAAGTHPFAVWTDTRVSTGARYQLVHESMRVLARREPTFALHVHVGISDPETALELMNRLRAHLPLIPSLRRGRRPADALRRYPRADIPVVGRACSRRSGASSCE